MKIKNKREKWKVSIKRAIGQLFMFFLKDGQYLKIGKILKLAKYSNEWNIKW